MGRGRDAPAFLEPPPAACGRLRHHMASAAAPAGADAARAEFSAASDAGPVDAAALRRRLLSYFRDSVEGEPGSDETDPLQARQPAARRCMSHMNGCSADASLSARSAPQNTWLEGDSLAPFVVTPMANVLRALECASAAPGG